MPALGAAVAAFPLALLFATDQVRAQYDTGFESLEVVPGAFSYAPDIWDVNAPTSTPGQDGFYWPDNTVSVPFQTQVYTGGVVLAGFNDYGIPDNPNGGVQFVVGNGPAGGTFARAQRDISYPAAPSGSQRWAWGTDLCVSFAGTLPTANNCGSFSVQPFPGSQSFIMLATWVDVTTAAQWNAGYIWFDAAGVQVTTTIVPDPAFQNLDINHWYRWETVGNLATNEIEELRITDLTTGISSSFAPTGAYMEGGTAGSLPPTGFRFFAGGNTAGNVIAWDNASVAWAGGISEIPGCGPNPADSLTVTSSPSWPTLGATLTFAVDAPAGTTGIPSIGGVLLSLDSLPTLPCGSPLPPPLVGNLLIGLPIGATLICPALWTTPGTAVQTSFGVPNNLALSGIALYAQGALFDPIAGNILLTTAARIDLGR
ncbi:MAG: hypothetical protein R3F29_06050 [Planctomycetota bacterium]